MEFEDDTIPPPPPLFDETRAPKEAGVYRITVTSPDGRERVYIGSSARHLPERKKQHWRALQARRHANKRLQACWDRGYTFTWEVLAWCNLHEVLDLEQSWIDASFLFQDCMNALPTAGNCAGYKHTPETRAKMSTAQREANNRPGVRETRSAAAKASNARLDVRAKLSAASREANARPDVKARISAASAARWACPEYRERMDSARRGSRRSPESLARMSAAQLAAQNRPDVIARHRANTAERWADPDYKARVGAAISAAHARRKAAKEAAQTGASHD